ncbi:MAG: hypothetical protein JHC95_08605 [Solirubrobacteraceae bacterium]|nr:hypothetical protein [Solirubrobacteraceae bacterium]
MSSEEPNVAPAGEDIHLPGGSVQPLLLTVGLTMTLIGVTWQWWCLVAGLVLTAGVLFAWIRGAVIEYRHLPLEHGEGGHH